MRLRSISQQLNSPSLERSYFTGIDETTPDMTHHHSKLAIEWEKTVDEVRRLPGFTTFLKPKAFNSLCSAALGGPIIVLNVDESRCDALVMMAEDNGDGSAISIPLPDFSNEDADILFIILRKILHLEHTRDRNIESPQVREAMEFACTREGTIGDVARIARKPGKIDAEKAFCLLLKCLWSAVVKPVIESLAYPVREQDLPRIWWCPTGSLAFLPIHAAGDYDQVDLGEKLSDYVVSSYTPTITALLDSPRHVERKDFKFLTVAVPFAPGANSIPNTMKEVEDIEALANGCTISLKKDMATTEAVLREMRVCNWAHFACHGQQDDSDPMKSALLLQDGRLELSKIVKETLSKADFAFLSACQTAVGDDKVAEESMHLAAGMLLSGYRSVVATTWSVSDSIAPRVAKDVYERILKDDQPNSKEAAYALHDAVKGLRESKEKFVSWVPFIHIRL